MYLSARFPGLCMREQAERQGNNKKTDPSFRGGDGDKFQGEER